MRNREFDSKSETVSKTSRQPAEARGEQAQHPLLRLQRTAGNRAVQRLLAQRQAEEEEEELQAKAAGGVQRQGGGEGFRLDDETAGRISRARGGGQPLDPAVRTQMGEAMGHDFGEVRVHTDAEADDLNQELSAQAFATGRDIFFRQGAYDPSSGAGRELIAHELTHVVQQSSGRVSATGSAATVRPPGDAFEQEARTAAEGSRGALAESAVMLSGADQVQASSEVNVVQREMQAGLDTAGPMLEVGMGDSLMLQDPKPTEGLWTSGMGTCCSIAVARYRAGNLVAVGLAHWHGDTPVQTATQSLINTINSVEGQVTRAWVAGSYASNARKRDGTPGFMPTGAGYPGGGVTLFGWVRQAAEAADSVADDANCVGLSIKVVNVDRLKKARVRISRS